jgi:hypothetical protein
MKKGIKDIANSPIRRGEHAQKKYLKKTPVGIYAYLSNGFKTLTIVPMRL